jgi:hypothetical protein
MNIEDIKRMGQLYLDVVTEKKKKMDPVGDADADIDNDGDTDNSDEYLAKRRKAISKNVKGEAKDLDTKNAEKELVHDCASHVIHKEHGEGICIPGQHTLVENEDGTATVTHYDVLFNETLVKEVSTDELEIVQESSHMHKGKKKAKEEKISKDLETGKAIKAEAVDDDDDIEEAFSAKEIKMAIGVASDKRYAGGNYTGAVNAIEKIKKGLSKHKQVAAVLKAKNEDAVEEDTVAESAEFQKALSNPRGLTAIKAALHTMWSEAAVSHKGSEETKDTKEKQLKRSKGEADFVKKHKVDTVDGAGVEADRTNAGVQGIKKGKGRPGDAAGGDAAVVKPVKGSVK